MQKSFIERIFPQPSSPLLPTSRQERNTGRISLPSTPSPIISRPSSSPSRSHYASPQASQSLQPTPLSASIIHHSDPLMPVDRAARALQRTVQSLLDAQFDGLSAGLGAGSRDDVSSAGSVTPTPSTATPPRSTATLRTTPIRQPVAKRMSLRGARRGLARSMQDFVQLKEEELRIFDEQSQGRQYALDRVQAFENKKTALSAQVDAIRSEGTLTSAEGLQKEARQLDVEIKEVEERLLELKARQRHVLDRASQTESSVSSKLSSYTSSLDIIDRDVKQFLRRPPVHSTLPAAADTGLCQSMYDLKPERRTLEMAKEQWKYEQQFLQDRKIEAEREKAALEEGTLVWRQITNRINAFEKELRVATVSQPAVGTNDPQGGMHKIMPELDETIDFLESGLRHAEENDWNLLICCIGPELEAFQQGRAILRQTLGLPPLDSTPGSEEDPDGPDQDFMNGGALNSPGAESNKSLEDTMKAFGNPRPPKNDLDAIVDLRSGPADNKKLGSGFGPSKVDSESEEDDPGPDFLLSHS